LSDDLTGQPLKLFARLKAELLGQRGTGRLVHLERLRLPAGSIERQAELRDHALAIRIGLDNRPKLTDQLGVPAKREVRVDANLQRQQAKLLEAGDLDGRPVVQGDIGQGRPTPEHERLLCKLGRSPLVSVLRGGGCLGEQLHEGSRVEARFGELQAVASARSLESDTVPGQSLPKP
jgi:hypothetical protein